MTKEQIIFGGVGLIVLNAIALSFDVHYTDEVFWYMFAPVGVILGLAVRHLCPSE